MFHHLGRARRHLALTATFLSGLALGVGSMSYYAHAHHVGAEGLVETRVGGYKYIEPLMECEPADDSDLTTFKNEIEGVVERIREGGIASHVSVYFRDLNDGHSFSINPKDDFIPASLLKVPIMINILRIAEANPSILQRAVTVPPNLVVDRWQAFPPREFLKEGQTYTVDELLRRMIDYSDNTAAYLLTTLLPSDANQRLYKALGIDFHEHGGRSDWLSVEAYSSFFRVLYNATYLGREMSEKALALLAQSDIPPGIVNIAPQGTKVAKKFGHFSRSGTTDTQQLHLCGIVYREDHPYLLSVMTQGDDTGKLSAALSEVWAEVYRLDAGHDIGKAYSFL